MAAPTLTFSLTNGGTCDASQVMQNYNDLLNGITDGTKDLTFNTLNLNGTANLKGPINLGDAAADDITVTGSLASNFPVKTNNSFDVGSSTLGLAGVYLGNGGVGATCRLVASSHATSRTYSFPDAGAAANVVLSEGAATINGLKTFGTGISSPLLLKISGSGSGYSGFGASATNNGVSALNATVIARTVNPGSDITLNGLTGGVAGQIIYIVNANNDGRTLSIIHQAGTGNQDFVIFNGGNVSLVGWGGLCTAMCDGTHWFVSNP